MSRKNDLSLIRACVINELTIDFNDLVKTCTEFNDLIDCLYKDGKISDDTRNNAYLSIEYLKERAKIRCGSYSVRVV